MREGKLCLSNALLPEGWRKEVLISIDEEGFIDDVLAGTGKKEGVWIEGLAIPGMANVHSHAHQRAMAGLAEIKGPADDNFWTWREAMYRFVSRMLPEDLEAMAGQLYVEALKAGFTSIGEFQYLHHQPGGKTYEEPAEMSLRCLAAAKTAGIAITLLPTIYKFGGFGGCPAQENQKRFLTEAKQYVSILSRLSSELKKHSLLRVGMAPHSLRAVTPELLKEVLHEHDRLYPDGPIHIHVAEQMQEVEQCIEFSSKRPVELLMSIVPLSKRWCLIHATHMIDGEIESLAKSGAIVGLCPTTEANLGDGTFSGKEYLEQGGSFAIGSDSHIRVSVAEELRQLEYSQRLKFRARNVLATSKHPSTGRRLFEAAAADGARSLAQPHGALAKGMRADIVILDGHHPSLIAREGDEILDSWIFAGGNQCVKDVFVAGRQLVKDGKHVQEESIARAYTEAIKRMQNSDG